MKKAIAIVQIITILFWHGWNLQPLFADDSDIFGNDIAPNVMLLLDSSGSMDNEAGTLIPYSSSTTYTPINYRGTTLTTTTVYRRRTSGSAGGLSCRSSNPCYTVYAT
ncbi:MAG TPA: hypothetical protein VJ733_01980, partial [Candidatus Binatia bacterium]|nr:hypothetical protein [Candidatus Binatia bacterium]